MTQKDVLKKSKIRIKIRLLMLRFANTEHIALLFGQKDVILQRYYIDWLLYISVAHEYLYI